MSQKKINKKESGKSRTYMRKSERRDMIVNSAIPIFIKKGYHGTTIDAISKATGIAQGTIYIHFKNKLDVFRAVLVDIQNTFFSIMGPLFADSSEDVADGGNEALNYIKQKTLLIFKVFKKNRALIKMIFRDAPGLDPEIDGILFKMKQFMLTQIETEHIIFQRMGLIRKVDPRLSAQMTFGTMALICVDNIFEKESPDMEFLADQVCNLVFYGLVISSDNGNV